MTPSKDKFMFREMPTRLLLIGAILGTANGVFGFAQPLYLQYLGYSLTTIGALISAGKIVVVFTLILSGWGADRLGRRYFLTAGTLSMATALLLLALRPSIENFLASNILQGLAMVLYMPSLNSLLSEKVSGGKRKFIFGLNTFGMLMGNAVGKVLGGNIPAMSASPVGGFRVVFGATAFLSVIAMIISLTVTEIYNPIGRNTGIIPRSWRMMLRFALPQGILGFGAGLMVPWFPIYFKLRYSISYGTLGTAFFITTILMALSMIVSPILAHRFGSVRSIVVTQLLAVLALLLIPVSASLLTALVFFSVRMILMNMSGPIATAFMMGLVSQRDRASATSVRDTAWWAAWAIGNFSAGAIMEINLTLTFYITATFYLTYLVVFALFFRKYEDTDRKTEHGIKIFPEDLLSP